MSDIDFFSVYIFCFVNVKNTQHGRQTRKNLMAISQPCKQQTWKIPKPVQTWNLSEDIISYHINNQQLKIQSQLLFQLENVAKAFSI